MIYLIHGADSFRAREKLNEIAAEFRAKNQNSANLDIFDADSSEKDFSANKVKAAGQTLGFLSPSRMIVVKNLFIAGNVSIKKEIADFVLEMEKKKLKIDFVFFEEKEIGKKGAAGGKEWTGLAKAGKVFIFPPMSPAELRKWVLSKFAAGKTKIDNIALDKLIHYVSGDLWRLSAECEKLILLKMETNEKNIAEKKSVSGEDIEDIIKSDLSTSIFTTIDALARRDKKTALKLLEEHFAKGEAPLYIFSMFVYQFSNLIRVKELLQKGMFDSGEIASALKMHPFVAQKTVSYAAKFKFEYLKKVYKRMLEFDLAMKKGRIGGETALELIAVEVGNLA